VTDPTTETVVDVTMPQMGVSIAEGTIAEWKKDVGERIEADETICEISTDKIDTELPAPVGGWVAEHVVEQGETVEVGAVIARISLTEDRGEPAEAPTGPAPSAEAEVGATEAAAALSPPSDTAAPKPAEAEGEDGSAARRYSPVVSRIAHEHDIDLAGIEGTGREGRVRKQDVLAQVSDEAPEPPLHIESPYRPEPPEAVEPERELEPVTVPEPEAPAPPEPAPGPLPEPEAPPPPAPAPPPPAPVTAGLHPSLAAVLEAQGQPLSRMRRSIGEHMKRSLDTAATCTTWIEVDMSAVEAARVRLGTTALPIVARATIAALREHPALNAWLDGETYTCHEEVNLGIAVSLGEDGLIVPVIHGAQDLSEEGLAKRVRDLARRARDKELRPEHVQGGTFTITNPGQFGSIMATPVINQPQVAILDLEAVVKRPVVVDDAITVRPICILGLSWDHRALDGALSARFLATLKRNLEAT
jgi:pyruvate/2-oxoglutarate dehydrogenase complex dihydrolipoamide acyltransferase (E2) component